MHKPIENCATHRVVAKKFNTVLNCNQDLRLHCVLANAQKGLDSRVLVNLFEQLLDLSLLSIRYLNQLGFKYEVVSLQSQSYAVLVLCNKSTNDLRLIVCHVDGRYTTEISNHWIVRPSDEQRESLVKLRLLAYKPTTCKCWGTTDQLTNEGAVIV